jgi:hypothetical protein
MKKNKLQKYFLSISLLSLIFLSIITFIPKKAAADIAWNCKYTGSWQDTCYYTGYFIVKCTLHPMTSCAFSPGIEENL